MTKRFAFIDAETTGLDPKSDHILELAWAITDENFELIGEPRSYVIDHGTDWSRVWGTLRSAPSVVQSMHTGSGLMAALGRDDNTLMDEVYDTFVADTWPEEGVTTHLAGLSVEFDREFLRADNWGATVDHDIHHRLLNLSAIKLFLEAQGIPFELAPAGGHRALADVYEAIAQAKIFAQMFGTLVKADA